MYCRGETIRKLYKDLPRLQSFCSDTPWLLLTATCNFLLKQRIENVLHLSSISTTAVLPDRPEIFLKVDTATGVSVSEGLDWYIQQLRHKGREAPKAVLYCKYVLYHEPSVSTDLHSTLVSCKRNQEQKEGF